MQLQHFRFALLGVLAGTLLMAGEAGHIPEGFTPILQPDNLDGWYVSQNTWHGTTSFWKMQNGVLTIGQDRAGNGGLLVSKKKFRDVEVYLEVRPEWGCDGGLFLRTNDRGQGYQVMIDYLEGGGIGGVFLANVELPATEMPAEVRNDLWEKTWRKGDWNSVRARIEGSTAHITVWVNDAKVAEFADRRNNLPGGTVEGSIALQVHGGNRWPDGKVHQYRNFAVRELPERKGPA